VTKITCGFSFIGGEEKKEDLTNQLIVLLFAITDPGEDHRSIFLFRCHNCRFCFCFQAAGLAWVENAIQPIARRTQFQPKFQHDFTVSA
jgi:hypothetical protein